MGGNSSWFPELESRTTPDAPPVGCVCVQVVVKFVRTEQTDAFMEANQAQIVAAVSPLSRVATLLWQGF